MDFTEARDSEWHCGSGAVTYASLHLAPDRQPCQHATTLFFTGRMPFLPPNQQHQSTESSSNQCFFDDNNNDNENDKKYLIFVDDTKAKKKIKTRDENKIKINCTVFLTKISDTKFST